MINIHATFHKKTNIQDDSGAGKDRLWFREACIKRPQEPDIYIGSIMANPSKVLMKVIEPKINRRYRIRFERIDRFNDFFPQLINPSKVMPL